MRSKYVLFFALWLVAASAIAQNWPLAKPIRLIVAYPPGGVSDSVARALAQSLATQLATPVLVENKAGASGSIGMDAVAKAAADGYTLGFASTSPLSLNPHLARVAYDPLKDITPVSRVMVSPILLLATPATKVSSMAELLALARAKPGSVRWATSGMGSLGHIMQAKLSALTGAEFNHIPYKGGGQQITDGLGGQYDILTVNADAAVLQHIKAAKLRPLAVGSPARLDALPQTPTLVELGLESANLMSVFGVYAPAGVAPNILERLNAAIQEAIASPVVRERLLNGDNLPSPSAAAEFARQISADHANFGRLIKSAAIQLD